VSLGDRQITALQAMGKAFAGSRISLSEIVRVAIDDLIEKLRDMDNDAGIAYVLRRGREDQIFMQPSSAPEAED